MGPVKKLYKPRKRPELRPFGIRIELTSKTEPGKWTAENRFYRLSIGTYTPGELFVTTPDLQAKLAEYQVKPKTPVGKITVRVDHAFRRIQFSDYHPLNNLLFRQMGLSHLIDFQIEKRLAKEFPGYEHQLTREASRPRIRQMEKRGRDFMKKTLIPEAAKQSKAKFLRDHFTHRLRRKK